LFGDSLLVKAAGVNGGRRKFADALKV